jgi:hypothetical protein
MRHRLLVTAVLVSALGAAVGAEGRRIQIILDVSGSMKAPMGSGSKMEAAKRAIREAITGLDESAVVALRYYGHRVPQERKAESCKDTELVVPFQALDRSSFLRVVDGAVPRGQTPTAFSLEQAARDFGAASDEERSIVLVSDGEETCGGDPLATVRDLAAQGFKVKVHTIGFDVDAAARAQLESISRATGGEFYDARDAAALAESLRQVTQKALLVQRDSTFGEEIRGGNTFDDAVPLRPGIAYHLDHHQREDQSDYFAVDVKAGQKVIVSIQAFENGIEIQGERTKETGQRSLAGIALHGPDKELIRNANVTSAGQKEAIQVPVGAGQGGRFFVLVGSTIGDQHKNSRFEVQLVDLSDAKSGTDAGSTDAGAVPVELGAFTGNLHQNDDTDYFKFKVVPKAAYTFRVRPQLPKMQIEIAVVDRDGVEKGKQRAPNEGAAARVEGITFGYEGEAYLRIHTFQTYLDSEYAAEIIQTGGPAPTPTSTGAVAATQPAGRAAGETTGSGGGGFVVGISWVWLLAGLVAGGVVLAGVAAVAYRMGKR